MYLQEKDMKRYVGGQCVVVRIIPGSLYGYDRETPDRQGEVAGISIDNKGFAVVQFAWLARWKERWVETPNEPLWVYLPKADVRLMADEVIRVDLDYLTILFLPKGYKGGEWEKINRPRT